MAASCRRMASSPIFQSLSCFRRTALGRIGFHPLYTSPICRTNLQTKNVAERESSSWTLMAAVCLQRLPVISAECTSIEQQFKQLMHQMELEKSLLADHELRLLEDAERMSRKQADDYDSDEEDNRSEIVLSQDMEDSWEQKLKNFEPALRVRADVDKDLTSPERCLANSLILLGKQQVGSDKLWLLPQTQWEEGETLRQTAERALSSLPAAGLKATFVGNAPCGVYKYKLPKTATTESSVGRKVFFFKAIVSDIAPLTATNASFLWLKKCELQRYLTPKYQKKVDRFIFGL